ncbi:RNA polymerase sigma factor SigF [Streptomyces albofaciens JCM 4342]|uniref:RNA polymerase sigma factor SigF n=1 Tax=Streptomyces albofaciens TaxID=66866 RepID=UPI001239A980|nr:RNA polymerase sigma factor SigF [Streptomyces albofaciens]KAA6223121.1 RNA polymerase sigma factor SigF [Streptomyces albofaciens JCM 4342]
MNTALTSARARPATGPAGLPLLEDAGAVTPEDAREVSRLFFERLAGLPEGDAAHRYARDCLIEMNLSLVHYAVRRFRGRAEETEDMVQVGTIGLIKAIDRYDLGRGTPFSAFAVPYIVGEIKRFFRDTSWAVHVPRRLQELRIDLARARERLAHELNRAPTAAELARHLGIDEEEVIEGLYAGNGYSADSLDAPPEEGDTQSAGGTLAARLGGDDPALEKAENIQALKPLMDGLEERDRRILHMRFGAEMTQTQIGQALGISQMQVSRLLTRILASLREGMLEAN